MRYLVLICGCPDEIDLLIQGVCEGFNWAGEEVQPQGLVGYDFIIQGMWERGKGCLIPHSLSKRLTSLAPPLYQVRVFDTMRSK